MSFRAKVLSGFKWSFLGQFGSQFLSIIVSILMARMIAPEYFGKVAMVNVIIGFSSIFLDMGFGAALIQRKNIDQIYFSTVFLLNIGLGFLLSILLYSFSGLIEGFYGQLGLATIAKILSPIFLLSALGNIPRTYLTKAMDFKKISMFNFISLILGSATGLILAFMGHPLNAIIGQILVQTISANLLPLFLGRWKVGVRFSKEVLRDIGGFSAYLFGNNALNYWVRNIDNLLIGKYLGPQQLGIYSKSYSFLLIPLSNSSRAISNVLFPSLSEIQSDPDRIKKLYLNMIGTISLIIFPLMTGAFVTIDKVVPLVLGLEWLEAIEIIKVFSILAIIQSISSMVPNLYLSQGRADLMFKVGTPLRIMLISSIVIGLFWGIKGVAICYLLTGFLSAIINNYFAGRLVKISLRDIGSQLLFPAMYSLITGIIVYSIDALFFDDFLVLYRLLIQGLVGILMYIFLNEQFKPRVYKSFKELIIKK